jgi:hypothetical protein
MLDNEGKTKGEGEGETAQQNQSTIETTIASLMALRAMRFPFYSRESDTLACTEAGMPWVLMTHELKLQIRLPASEGFRWPSSPPRAD